MHTTNTLSKNQRREINKSLEHSFLPNAAEIYKGLSWAKNTGLVQQAASSPPISSSSDLQGSGW